jgi:hypothetical protein
MMYLDVFKFTADAEIWRNIPCSPSYGIFLYDMPMGISYIKLTNCCYLSVDTARHPRSLESSTTTLLYIHMYCRYVYTLLILDTQYTACYWNFVYVYLVIYIYTIFLIVIYFFNVFTDTNGELSCLQHMGFQLTVSVTAYMMALLWAETCCQQTVC